MSEASTASVAQASPGLSRTYVTLAVLSVVAAVLVAAWTSPDWIFNREADVSIESSIGNTSASLVDKYESNMVKISPHPLLVGTLSDAKCPDFQPSDEGLAHVELVLGKEQQLRDRNQVFFLLNGQNEGIYMPWTHQSTDEACVLKLAQTAALHLGLDLDLLVNGIKLLSVDGLPILTVDELDAQRIAYVLLDGQLWVWPGVKVGYKREIEGCTVTTQSLRPKVFTVEGFFTQEEADAIIAEGVDHLSRSPVDSPDAQDGYHADRTSFTAFLDDSYFTRDFRVRSSRLARLPSPSYTEKLQLVRYETGQFFRKHEDYFDSKVFVPTENFAADQFEEWVTWASSTINQLRQHYGDNIVPVEFLPGGAMFPDIQSTVMFHHALLKAFMEDAEASNFFWEHADLEWKNWIAENLDLGADNIMGPILESKGYMLPFIVTSWTKRAGHSELVYSFPKAPISGVSYFFRWIQWAKDRVQTLMDTQPEAVPKRVRPEGEDYPTYFMSFQNRMASHILEDYSRDFLVEILTEDFYAWLVDNKDNEDILLEILRNIPSAFDLVVDSWTKRAGNVFTYVAPKYLRHFEPNRFATLFLYLNDCPEGGETVFPYSKERLVTGIKREGMEECSDGLAVPPVKLTASLFYSQTPMNELDPSSLHGGCPPAKGVKFGANSFMWNADADEGANAWGMGEDIKSMSAVSQQ